MFFRDRLGERCEIEWIDTLEEQQRAHQNCKGEVTQELPVGDWDARSCDTFDKARAGSEAQTGDVHVDARLEVGVEDKRLGWFGCTVHLMGSLDPLLGVPGDGKDQTLVSLIVVCCSAEESTIESFTCRGHETDIKQGPILQFFKVRHFFLLLDFCSSFTQFYTANEFLKIILIKI